jgi:DNA-directed RNA polymerase specialized sigma24 family protein
LRKGHRVENKRAWLFRVAHNLAIDFSRRAPTPESLDALAFQRVAENVPDPSPNAEEQIVDRASRQRMLKYLTRHERQCMELRAEGLRYRQFRVLVLFVFSAGALPVLAFHIPLDCHSPCIVCLCDSEGDG